MTIAQNLKEINYDKSINRQEFAKFAVTLDLAKNKQRNKSMFYKYCKYLGDCYKVITGQIGD